MTYHPLNAPDPAAWLALPEAERVSAVADCQRAAGVATALPDSHTRLHVTVENRLAHGPHTPFGRAAARLMAEGLDRHETIHALASVFSASGLESGDAPGAENTLDSLTALSWRAAA